MKIPLRYQMTEYDCGPVSFLNAISFLFEREEILPELIKIINDYTLDIQGKFGDIGTGGTSREAIIKLVNCLNRKKDKFKMLCTNLEKGDVNIKKITDCLNSGGCVFYRTYIKRYEHYVIITELKKKKIYIFDPYYLKENIYGKKNIKFVLNKPFNYNRIVHEKNLLDEEISDYSLGPINGRQCVLIKRIK